jgi:hypothetical protein
MFCLETDSLAPSPKPAVRTFVIDPDSLIATPHDITNKEDSEISIEDTDCIPHSPPRSPAAAPKITIPRKVFKELRDRPIPQITADQISDQANPLYSPPTDTTNTTSNVSRTTPTAEQIASEINKDLRQLYQNLRAIFEPAPEDDSSNPISQWEYDSEDNWKNRSDNATGQYNDVPPQGNSTHPPSQWVCGKHPGMGWELNDPLTTCCYRVLIPDPTTNRLIFAPFISYAIQYSKAEVQATYGKDYPIHNRVLQPLPVDYLCPPLTPDQLAILDSRAPFAEAVNKIINQNFPLHISAAIKQYQHLQEKKYSAQQHIRRH